MLHVHCIILGTCCLCIRNLTCSLHSFIWFLIRQLLVGKYHMYTLSMKYPLNYIYVHTVFVVVSTKRSCGRGDHTSPWSLPYVAECRAFCLSELSVLQVANVSVAMASRKKFWQLKLLWKSPIWRPIFSYHVSSFSQEIPEILQDAFF